MTVPFYRAVRCEAIVGLPLAELEIAMGPAAYAAAAHILLANVAAEPLHVEITQDGQARQDIVVVPILAYQIDGGLNEIPRATCLLAHGRNAHAVIANAAPEFQVSVAHVLERYLGNHARAKIYGRRTTTATSGIYDPGDNDPLSGEWEVLFDGYAIAPTVRGSPTNHAFVLQLTHILGGLTYSSALSADVVAGTGYPAAFITSAFQTVIAGSGFPQTPMGAAAATLAGGAGLYTDFWGYRPGIEGVETGVKGFLLRLANGNLFNVTGFNAALGGAACNLATGQPGTNRLAATALSRIEPLGLTASGDWDELHTVMTSFQAGAGGRDGITRLELLDRIGDRYHALGYRYGMPLSFYLTQTTLANAGRGQSFAADIVGATFPELGPASFWDLLATRYPSNYQIALAPSATRAIMIPAVVGGTDYWQTVHASEITDWSDDLGNPIPVRGLVLVGQRSSLTGAFGAGPDATQPATRLGLIQMDGAYDSCTPGVVLMRDMPVWLASANRAPAVGAPALAGGVRTTAASPAQTAILGPAAVGIGGLPPALRSTANRLAKALYQQARLFPRTLAVTTRFRTDIAPGSLVRFEVPTDRFVRAALGDPRNSYLSGLVTRVTMTFNAESMTAATILQVGFVRLEAETQVDNPLYTSGHPFWSTVCYGLPWADSAAVRTQLGNGSIIGAAG